VVVFGMGDIGRTVADALEAHGVPYDAIEGDYDRFLDASADGYRVAFGQPSDVRLMHTLAFAEREVVVATQVGYEAAEALELVMRERYPSLICFAAVDTDADKARFQKLGLRAVINRSVPQGLDLAAAVLRHQGIEEANIHAWMQRQQERMLQDPDGGVVLAVE
jgi:CPA2 family monovalent cation:H+ antiporter-2